MEAALAVLNEMEKGGVFVLLTPPPGNLVSLTPIYEFLEVKGATVHREHFLFAGTLLQIIPAFDPLTEEAVRDASRRVVGSTPTHVMTAEHLIAIALKTGRAKDHGRIVLLLEEADIDHARLQEILSRHGLLDAWTRFLGSTL